MVGTSLEVVSGVDVPRKITNALISVFDKTGVVEFAEFLTKYGVALLSTGGTYTKLKAAGINVTEVSEYTGSPEILDGRVKSLHPKVHGGLLAVRGNERHEKEMEEHMIKAIDLVCVNLYPFEHTVKTGSNFYTCMENIDIGGPAMIRAAAKNNPSVLIVTTPAQYEETRVTLEKNSMCSTPTLRKAYAAEAFSRTAEYDSAITEYFSTQPGQKASMMTTRIYTPEITLKYGCNPLQTPASICRVGASELPLKVLHGVPGYINLLDALNAWQLVQEVCLATNQPAAASFKHVSPAGAAIGKQLSELECEVYEVGTKQLTPLACAYVRARNGDPLCSFGDFAAVSDVVDAETAMFLKTEVSDGIIAPGYDEKALEILSAKKNGTFIVLKANPNFTPPELEYREVFGAAFMQKRNTIIFNKKCLDNIVTESKVLPNEAQEDCVLASICLKYTQSNSVAYAKDGQVIGVGAGQQSRVDCVKLAGRKATTWYLRQHPKVRALQFKEGVKRQERVNARVRYIEGDFTEIELAEFNKNFIAYPQALTTAEKNEFLKTLKGVSLSSDAFFPFRDNIDHASKIGVQYVVNPGGSVQDTEVVRACDSYKMTMCNTGIRLFHH